MKHTIIINKRRFYSFVLLAVLILSLLMVFLFAFISKREAYGAGMLEGEEYIVKAGDSVWSIAGPIAEHQKRDVRDVVRDIYRSNGLADKTIHPGQSLVLPFH